MKTRTKKYPVRIATPKPTEWHKDKSKYNRKKKYKGSDNGNDNG
jgi:hypothetical protein